MSARDRVLPPAVADVLGVDGVYRDSMWRVSVALSGVEIELLRTSPRPITSPARRRCCTTLGTYR